MVSIRASAMETFVKWWDARAGMLTVSPCVGGDLFAAEGELDLALKDVEHLLEVVAVLLPYL